MGSILKKAVRGLASAGAEIATDRLSELRQRRLAEFQQNLGREERDTERADRKAERQQEVDMRTSERVQDMDYRKSRDSAQDAQHQQNIERSDRQFDTTMGARGEEQEYSRVSGAYQSAMGSVTAAQRQLEAAMKMKPPVDDVGQPTNDPSFGASREQAIAQAQDALEQAKVTAMRSHKEISSRFPQYKKYFDPSSPATSTQQSQAIPPLLRRSAAQ